MGGGENLGQVRKFLSKNFSFKIYEKKNQVHNYKSLKQSKKQRNNVKRRSLIGRKERERKN